MDQDSVAVQPPVQLVRGDITNGIPTVQPGQA